VGKNAFGGISCLNIQGEKKKIMVVLSPEMLVHVCQILQSHIPEEDDINFHHPES
jgi:hypothetical protein